MSPRLLCVKINLFCPVPYVVPGYEEMFCTIFDIIL